MPKQELKITPQSIRNELREYSDKPLKCLCEFIWNSFDAGAQIVALNFDKPDGGLGVVKNVQLVDNGKGWNLDDINITDNFISSEKKSVPNKTLPHGKYGKGRYTFIWLCNFIEVFSGKRKLTLNKDDIELNKEDSFEEISGTKILFNEVNEKFSDFLLSDNLIKELSLQFGWFLIENDCLTLTVNGVQVDPSLLFSGEIKKYQKKDLPLEICSEIHGDFKAKIVIWKEKPEEFSKFYFLNTEGLEVVKHNTGLNKKSDDFWHSVYVYSELFSENDTEEEVEDKQLSLALEGRDLKRLKNKIKDFLKKELVNIRKPILKERSSLMYKDLKDSKILPNLTNFGVYDDASFEELIKTIYIISPSLFTQRKDMEKKFICATFAGLLSSGEDNLIQLVLEQLQELTEDEKDDFHELLKRTRLSNIVRTIKEIDNRLEVVNKLKSLLSEYKKETLEVKHIQKILDENFWIFGEQFRLFSTTEGALKNTLLRYAKEILEIPDPELVNKPTGELDLFLTKTEYGNEMYQKNIVVELKRASIKITKKEYDQIESYMEKIIEEPICNGENQSWEFYLIGNSFDEHINGKIKNAENHGEKNRGLCYNVGRAKIYVRKWSDILEVEWENKMKYLKEKLKIQNKPLQDSPDKITLELLKK